MSTSENYAGYPGPDLGTSAQTLEENHGIVVAYAEVRQGGATGAIVVIERRSLIRGCFAASIGPALQQTVVTFGSVREWMDVRTEFEASLVIFSTPDIEGDEDAQGQFLELVDNREEIPVIVSSDSEAPNTIVDALQRGARGYIPTSLSLEVWIEALRLIRAGGVFAPVDSLIEARTVEDAPAPDPVEDSPAKVEAADLLTTRESTVVNALRRGKANKVIAYELNMCESTVKVHVRNIMKKLGARNRTEVAYLANQMSGSEGGCA